jgi:hypothetical protein
VKLQAEVATLRESNREIKLSRYLDKKLASASKEHSPDFIKAFREALGRPRSIEHVEEIWSVFTKAADVAGGDEYESEEDTLFTENASSRLRESNGGAILDFSDCAKRRS